MLEPMHGVAFAIEKLELSRAVLVECGISDEDVSAAGGEISFGLNTTSRATSGIQLGQLISDSTNAFRLALLASPVRLVEPIYSCDLQCDQSQLRNLYAVLSRRRGTVMNEDIIDGTSLFLINASIPVAESFGFAQELLERTGGNAISPQLTFSHWMKLDIDPFWVPTTAEELEDFGSQTTDLNNARIFIDKVRRRKGLPVEEKIVASAEKQRTLTKNK
jgi:ribosome assembly protein 1